MVQNILKVCLVPYRESQFERISRRSREGVTDCLPLEFSGNLDTFSYSLTVFRS